MMTRQQQNLETLAEAVLAALLAQGFVQPKTPDRAPLRAAIVRAIVQSMEEEADLEEEAARMADSHARQMVGMDRHKIIQGIKERLARERGFPL